MNIEWIIFSQNSKNELNQIGYRTPLIHRIKDFWNYKKSKARILIKSDQSLSNLQMARWNAVQSVREFFSRQIFVQNVELMDEKLIKLKFCKEAKQTLLLKRLKNNWPHSWCIYLTIFSFTRSTGSHDIQLVPNIQNTSFHHPVKISLNSWAAVTSI